MPDNYTAVATKIIPVTPEVSRFLLKLEGPKPLSFKAGQFLMIDLTQPDGTIVHRAYSVASAPDEQPVELIVEHVEGGRVTSFLFHELKEGGSFPVRAPFGPFSMREPLPPKLLFVATGTGIAPIRSMIRSLYRSGEGKKHQVTLILGIRYEDQILYDDEWKALAAANDFIYIPTISRPRTPAWKGEVGYVQAKAEKYVTDPAGLAAYACGSRAMTTDLGGVLTAKGLAKDGLHFEVW
ncbi:MAG: FAD-binding oxidoreductase [Candidatus Coatesbacteria bacterium]